MNQTEGLPRIFIASIEANDLAEMSFACKDIFPECKLVQSSDSAALRVALESDHYDIVIFRRGMDKDLRPGARRRGLPAALLVSGRLHAVEARRSAAALAADCLLVDDDASPRALLGAWLAGFSVAPRPAGGELRYERRYEDLVQALPDIVYELDPRGIITFVNDSVSLLGYTAEELLGKHFSTFLHEDDAEAVDRDRILGDYRGRRTGLADRKSVV